MLLGEITAIYNPQINKLSQIKNSGIVKPGPRMVNKYKKQKINVNSMT